MFLIVCKNCRKTIANYTCIISVNEDHVIDESYCEKCYSNKHNFRVKCNTDGKYCLETLENGKVIKRYDVKGGDRGKH